MMSCPKISFKAAYRFIGAIMQHRFVVVEHISANVWPNKLTECSFPGNFNLIIGKPSNKINFDIHAIFLYSCHQIQV